MSDINKRVEEVRKAYNLSMEKFGSRIGITRSSVNSIEKGVNNPSEQTIKLICKEFNIDYLWLTEGIGDDMFTEIPETLLDNIALEYKLTDEYKAILKAFLEVPDENKPIIQDFFLSIAKNVETKDKKKDEE